MRKRHLYHCATGGTIGSGKNQEGVRDLDLQAQSITRQLLERIPYTSYEDLPVQMRGDSSAHSRADLVDFVQTVISQANQADGVIVEHGTDTLNLTTAATALAGNEVLTVPVTFLASIRGPDQKGSDAPENTFTAGIFTAFGDASGVFSVRPNGIVVTSRHDTPAGMADWHSRGALDLQRAWQEMRRKYYVSLQDSESARTEEEPTSVSFPINRADDSENTGENLFDKTRVGYFAKVNLAELVDAEFGFKLPRAKKRQSPLAAIHRHIVYQRIYRDGTLDTADSIPVGGRGRTPQVHILDLPKETITKFKQRPVDDTPNLVYNHTTSLVEDQITKGKGLSRVILSLALGEHIRRHRAKIDSSSDTYNLRDKWEPFMEKFLETDLHIPYYLTREIISFWKKNSEAPNGAMDFSGLAAFRVSTDPNYIYRLFQHEPPRGVILQATGAAGIRLREEAGESYGHLLKYCREAGIPVVLTSSSRGEVTSFEYGPGRQLLEEDLVFFAGTMDADLVEPRLALLNAAENQRFMDGLVGIVESTEATKKELKRGMYRQLLSGTHYRAVEPENISDRSLIEARYGIETRVDLLGDMQVKKAILASYLHEMAQRELAVPREIIGVLRE